MHHSGTRILPSSLIKKADITQLDKVVKEIKKDFDFVIIDSAAGLGEDALSAINAADECLIVANPEMPSITWAMKTIETIHKMKKAVLGVLITRKTRRNSLNEINSMLEYPVLGIIPEDDIVKKALREKETLLEFPGSKASKNYKKLAEKLIYGKTKKKNLKDFLKKFKITIKFGE